MWGTYVITFVGSLAVALASVWFARWWSSRRNYYKTLQSLRAEMSSNVEVSKLICEWVDKNLEASKEGKMVVAGCPHLYDSAWVMTRGDLFDRDYPMMKTLEKPYLLVDVIDELIRTYRGYTWGIGIAVSGSRERGESTLKCIRDTTINHLLPKLKDSIGLLDNKLTQFRLLRRLH